MMPWPYPDDAWRPRADDPDARLTRQVREALRAEGLPRVRAEAQSGVVILRGSVDSALARAEVIARARAVPGVRDIASDITVVGAESDPDTFGEIAARLAAEPPERPERSGSATGVLAARAVLVVACIAVLLADTAGWPLMILGAAMLALAAALLLRSRGRRQSR